MARRPRNYLPGYSYHLVQRGVNRAATFFDELDYRIYLRLWAEYAQRYNLDTHAYCLMTNHVHFLVTPGTSLAISSTSRCVGSNYTSYINKRYGRTGTLWEARHKSSLIDSESYLLQCYRYIDLNPVRAGLTQKPDDYAWSSYRHNISGSVCWLTPHAVFSSLGSNTQQRTDKYREFVTSIIPQEETETITRAIASDSPLGRPDYFQQLEERLGVNLVPRVRGRPRKKG